MRKGAKVYMAARNEKSANEAMNAIRALNLPGSVFWLELDLVDCRNAQRAARLFLEKEDRLDILGQYASFSRLLGWR